MRLTKIKDCKNCENSIVIGNKEAPIVKCNSMDYTTSKLFRDNGRYFAGQCKSYIETTKQRTGAISQDRALEFLLAGNSNFILYSTKTKEDYQFELIKQQSRDNKEKYIYFVSLVKPNEKIYAGIVIFDKEDNEYKFKQGQNGNIPSNELSIRSLIFVMNKLYKGENVGNLEVYHVGKCCYCGKNLGPLDNIESGKCKLCKKSIGIK